VPFDAPQLTLHEERPEPGMRVLAASGEIHVSTAPQLAERLAASAADDVSWIVVDLTDVGFIDSTGLSVLLEAQRRVTRGAGALALVIVNPTVLRLFEITRLDSTFAIEPTRAGALARVRETVGC
jgi:anti-anti-sigma factor